MTEITCYECNQPVDEPLYDSKGFAYCADCFAREEDTTEHIGYWYTPKGDKRYEAAPETKEEVDAFLVERGYDLDQLDKNADALVWKALREVTAERDALKAALKPFAAAGADLDDYDADNSVLHMEFTHGYWPVHFGLDDAEPLTVEHLKAAARALKAEDTDGA